MLSEDTQILTYKKLSRASDIQLGDMLITHVGRLQKVMSVSVDHFEGSLIIIIPFTGPAFKVTSEHGILTTDGWKQAVSITLEDLMVVVNDKPVQAKSISTVHYNGSVYDFTVERDHSYVLGLIAAKGLG